MDLNIQNVIKSYGAVKALDNVSLNIPHGSLVCFLGPSGCGKTTLLRAVAGLEDIDSGRIMLGDNDLSHTPARSRNFGVVFQSYSLFPHMTAARNIAYGLECRSWTKAQIAARVREMLDLVHLANQAEKLPAQMSGGQQQRIAIARALAPNPSLLLLDEPLSALDAKVREELRNEIRALQKRVGITTIMVTHDQEEALAMADVIVVMKDGHIEQTGTPQTLYQQPLTSFVADFIGRMNILPLDKTAGNSLHFADKVLKLDVAEVSGSATVSKVGIRPEAVSLLPATQTMPDDNHFPATIRSQIYLGHISRLEVVPDKRPDVKISVEMHGTANRAGYLPQTGDAVTLHLPADALRVLS
ncbi:ATP-binding cassette domain-containing protein [Pseudochrobactrum sp. Wa41.01b-1]|uniref:ABC transporter ATP-binding protein n=1 Tax=Pseudochrobactrum sp. Wa41.01b-1 TaxID=2864102 RepID=UPI001C68C4D9|nr:ATP-binding cassette domain-containing protein [Pseudochrobactrum sp. Wa41.01b-1]QYM72686.1 ATP-binding cassette domain-containing protein [Pseudochrobactrum sp. Wa41.01b-1]